MCGILGGINIEKSKLYEVLPSLYHRGPDEHGIFSYDNIHLLHARLKIQDLETGQQPFVLRDLVLVLNGEIYNHLDLRCDLEKVDIVSENSSAGTEDDMNPPPQNLQQMVRGRWRGHSDTETLLAAIAAWDVEATLRRCVGMFAFALWDRKTQTLTLARDRMGEKPLYYGWQGDAFIFGSELKTLKTHPAFRSEIEQAEDPAGKLAELEAYFHRLGSPFRTAERFGILDIIDPRETRAVLCDWVEDAWQALGARGSERPLWN